MVKEEKKYLLIAQEIKLAKILAGNNKKLRDRTLKRLGKWLQERTEKIPISEDVFMRIWKGLFYTMWMSDKPLIQEECAENISKLVHLGDINKSLMFFKCFLNTMLNEWFGIDYHRIDKFLMLVRRVLRQTLHALKADNFHPASVFAFREILNSTVLQTGHSSALGLVLHIDEIYLEELAKVSRGKLDAATVLDLVQPFAQQIARVDDVRQLKHASVHVFKYLMEQSDVGIEYKERFQVWRQQGFPEGTIESIEKVVLRDETLDEEDNNDDNEDEDIPHDPRAGKVDVILPQLKYNPLKIAELLDSLRFKKYTTPSGRKTLNNLISQFKCLSKGKYPLGLTKVETVFNNKYSTQIRNSVKRLNQFQHNLTKDTKKGKVRTLHRKKIKNILLEQINKVEDVKTYEDFVRKSESNITPKKKRKMKNDSKIVTKKSKISTSIPVINTKKIVRNSGIWTVDEFDVPENPWNEPLKEGETEIFVVSTKTKQKLKAMKKKVVDNFTTPTIVKNPFSKRSEKKIKFSESNQTQELQEHLQKVTSSPGIPYDSQRRPVKPLLKPSPIATPVNPFYKLKY